MSIISQNKKWITWSVILSFLFLIQVSSLPLEAENGNQPEQVSQGQKVNEPGAIERTAPAAKAKKKSILPYILIGLGVVAVGAAVYFLVIKKQEYTLSVTLGEGIEGTPAAGSHTYKKGESVSYNYTLSGGFKDLQVQIDGAPAAASGTITMNGDHSISATSTKVASIAVNSTPTGALIYDNGVNTGKVTNAVLEYPQGGIHGILVRICGYQDFGQQVSVDLGQQQTINANLREGIKEDFNVELATCWKTVDMNEWTLVDGELHGTAQNGTVNQIMYDHKWNNPNYTVTSRMKYISGNVGYTLTGFILSETNDIRKINGYIILVYDSGHYRIFRLTDFDPYFNNGIVNSITQGFSNDIGGMNSWNEVKLVKNGNTYTMSANGAFLQTFTDASYSPCYVSLAFGSLFATEAAFDNVLLEVGTTAPAPQKLQKSITKNMDRGNLLHK